MTEREPETTDGPVVRDKRRIDPDTFEVRQPPADASGEAPAAGRPPAAAAADPAEVAELRTALAERTADLQRLQAEYVNYKRRVDRDRDLARSAGVEGVLRDLLSVLDDVRSARLHEELSAGFKAVAEEVERVAGKYGLESFGEKGDAFNPHIHEALLHAHLEGIDGPTCVEILQPGYRIKDKVVRPARVAVAEPSGAPADNGAEARAENSAGTAAEEAEAERSADGAAGNQATADEQTT
ncbi:MAG TPA: nucleotide exchange factor GrpE [Propionibacteriaceae bacterium]|nr:nucleotide exchange factor GrpE [Propionibacteriaceae bacterium]